MMKRQMVKSYYCDISLFFQSRVFCVVFHPDDKQIARGSFDGVVKCWDVQSGACLETFHANSPHAGMDITGLTGISEAQ